MQRLIHLFPTHVHATLHDAGLLVLRLVFGGVMVYAHGWGKLTGYGDLSAGFPDPLGVGSQASVTMAVFAEVFCALAIVVGLFTRLASLPLIVTMFVAFFIVHADDPFGRKELALVYLGAYVVLLFQGAGRWSVDAFLARSGPKAG